MLFREKEKASVRLRKNRSRSLSRHKSIAVSDEDSDLENLRYALLTSWSSDDEEEEFEHEFDDEEDGDSEVSIASSVEEESEEEEVEEEVLEMSLSSDMSLSEIDQAVTDEDNSVIERSYSCSPTHSPVSIENHERVIKDDASECQELKKEHLESQAKEQDEKSNENTEDFDVLHSELIREEKSYDLEDSNIACEKNGLTNDAAVEVNKEEGVEKVDNECYDYLTELEQFVNNLEIDSKSASSAIQKARDTNEIRLTNWTAGEKVCSLDIVDTTQECKRDKIEILAEPDEAVTDASICTTQAESSDLDSDVNVTELCFELLDNVVSNAVGLVEGFRAIQSGVYDLDFTLSNVFHDKEPLPNECSDIATDNDFILDSTKSDITENLIVTESQFIEKDPNISDSGNDTNNSETGEEDKVDENINHSDIDEDFSDNEEDETSADTGIKPRPKVS